MTKAKQALELCAKVRLAMTIEDTWGGDITIAAILHMAHFAPAQLQFTVTDFNSYTKVSTGTISGVVKQDGLMKLPRGPSLGVMPNWEVLGEPLFLIK